VEAQSPKLINNNDSDASSELSDENYNRVIRENKIRYDPKKKIALVNEPVDPALNKARQIDKLN
jgi:hypothetical protein